MKPDEPRLGVTKRVLAARSQQMETMTARRRYPNSLGVWGWLGGGRWGIERYAYSLHRLTGLALVAYLVMHIGVTALRVWGVYLWDEGRLLSGPVFKVGELLVFAAFAYHALNGVRLVLVELGFAVGRPLEPVYPYKTSLGIQRPLLVLAMALAALAVLAGGLDLAQHWR
jgi:succinate dehydrogenase / fumarate reductase cytochrome b subunit